MKNEGRLPGSYEAAVSMTNGTWLTEETFLILRAIAEVKSDPKGGCGVSFPRGLRDGRSLTTGMTPPCSPVREERKELFLDSFQLCGGSSRDLKKTLVLSILKDQCM